MFKKQRSYFKKLFLTLAVFSALLMIPYALFSYFVSARAIRQANHDKNLAYLKQIDQSFSYNRKDVASLLYSIYFKSEFQSIMYARDLQENTVRNQLRAEFDSVKAVNDSLYSMSVYNSTMDTVYSTSPYEDAFSQSSVEFFRSLENPKELNPYYRTVFDPLIKRNIGVFTYFIFDYAPESNPSFLAVDQYASWLLERAETSLSPNYVNSDFFIIGSDVGISASNRELSQDFLTELEAAFQGLLSQRPEFTDMYTLNIQGVGYSAAFWQLGSTENYVVMLQETDDLYADVYRLQRLFALGLAAFCALMVFAVVFVSRQLYAPIASLADNITKGEITASRSQNEFELFKEFYQQSSAALAQQDQYKSEYLQGIQLERVLIDETGSAWNQFCRLFPAHWLNTETGLRYFCISISLDTSNRFENAEDEQLHVFAVRNIICELLENHGYVEAFQTKENDVVCVHGCRDDGSEIRSILSTLAANMKQYFSVTLFSCCSQGEDQQEQLPLAFHDVQILREYYPLFGPDTIISKADVKENLRNPDTVLPDDLVQSLLSAIQEKDEPLIQACTAKLCTRCKSMNIKHLPGCLFSLQNQINHALLENRFIGQMIASGKFSEMHLQLSDYDTVDNLFDSMSGKLSNIVTQLDKPRSEKNQQFLDQLYEYVDQNYSDSNLSSQTIGEHLGYSPKHVMKRFKELTGDSLVDYVLRVRMKRAAWLLLNTKSSSSTIGKQVGINNSSYFFKLFKRTYGCTPKEYVDAFRDDRIS